MLRGRVGVGADPSLVAVGAQLHLPLCAKVLPVQALETENLSRKVAEGEGEKEGDRALVFQSVLGFLCVFEAKAPAVAGALIQSFPTVDAWISNRKR